MAVSALESALGVGFSEGAAVDICKGASVGEAIGEMGGVVGASYALVGLSEGAAVGVFEGASVGEVVGEAVVDVFEGASVGEAVREVLGEVVRQGVGATTTGLTAT